MNKKIFKFLIVSIFLGFIIQPNISHTKEKSPENGYTINFQDISAIEYIKFISKVCNINFLYNESELQFNISVVSDGPISKKDMLSTLIQEIRIHGLTVLEQDDNLIIHQNDGVTQLAKVTDESDGIIDTPLTTHVFRINEAKVNTIAKIIRPLISKNALLETSSETKQIIVTDITTNISKIKDLLTKIDSAHSGLETRSYVVKNLHPKELIELANKILLPIIGSNTFSMVANENTDTVYIVSSPNLIAKTEQVLANLDVPAKQGSKAYSENVFIFKPKNKSAEELKSSVMDLAKNLQENGYAQAGIVETLQSVKEVKQTNSLLFNGSKKVIKQLQDILSSLDVKSAHRSSFFVYKVKNVPYQQLIDSLKNMGSSLGDANVGEKDLINTLNNVKFIQNTNSLIFTGNEKALKRLEELLPTFDISKEHTKTGFIIYHLKSANQEDSKNYLENIKDNLSSDDVDLAHAISTMKWIPNTYSYMFSGTTKSLEEIKKLLTKFDSPGEQKNSTKSTYLLYKLQHVSGDIIEEDIDNFITKIKDEKISDKDLLDTLENIKWIKQTNSLLITGTPRSITQAKQVIVKFDIERKGTNAKEPAKNFFMYRPKNMSIQELEKSIKDVANNLEKARLADPNFLSTISSMKFVTSSNSLVFTGNKESLTKIEALIKTIDIPASEQAAIQQIGKKTILVYKIHNAPANQIMSSLKSIAHDLKKGGVFDKELVSSLQSVRFMKDTHSLIFTGTKPSLEKIKPLVEKFDISTGKDMGPSSYYIYKPEYQAGPELEKTLDNFSDHLRSSGFENKELYNIIHTLKWDDVNNTMIFTGSEHAISEVKDLLKTFDIPGKGTGTKKIQSIDDTSFLVYKLQYHKGTDIQNALKQIAKDLIKTNAKIKQTLLDSINSIQWIEITNSLLCSGDQETMTRLKELIKSLDIPLKQVFIEMLVVETEMDSLLDFGLDWGSKFKFKDRIAGSIDNAQSRQSGTSSEFFKNFRQVSGSRGPKATDVPFAKGFGLGIIGDIIMHKGQSFTSLGSFITAIQTDSQSTVVMTPKIIAQDSKTSSIFIGRNIPYVGSQITNNASNTVTTTNLEYRDVGMDLSLTPVLGNSDAVTLSIDLTKSNQLSDASGSTGSGSAGNVQGITTSKTAMNTTVHIPNKHFLILSGMVNESKRRNKSGIPCLGSLPLIGAAFSEVDKNSQKNNIVIFIRPHVINTYKDMVALSENQENFFRENTGDPTLERDFEESTELIKSIEDD
jgi:type III secretion protein C